MTSNSGDQTACARAFTSVRCRRKPKWQVRLAKLEMPSFTMTWLIAAHASWNSNSLNYDYFQQKVQYLGLRNTSFATMVAEVDEHSSEMQRLLKREGPKYQYGNGCLSDGVIGAWMARIYGIETPLGRENVRTTLQAIFQHNFKKDLSLHANAQRPGYAMGHEPGLLLCTWPKGGRPTLPFVYSDEVWTGIEYQVASSASHRRRFRQGRVDYR